MSESDQTAGPPERDEAELESGAESGRAMFRVRCPDCGPQHVAASDLRFVETVAREAADAVGTAAPALSAVSDAAKAVGASDAVGTSASANRYVFACPQCGNRVRRPAGPELSEILRASGVATLALHRGPGLR